MKTPNLAAAYSAARSQVRYFGPPGSGPYDVRFQGPRPAAESLALARINFANLAHALAACDLATARLNAATPDERAAAANAATNAGKAVQNARHALAARPFPLNRSPYSTAGTWQPEGDSYGRKPGGRFWFYHGGAALRNVTDSKDILKTWRRSDESQFCCDPDGDTFRDGSGLVFGVVAQLRARDGRARFVPGWRFGGNDDDGTFDLADIFTADGSDDDAATEAQIDAARAANELARLAAERESEYQTAWRAGAWFENLGEQIAHARRAALALLAERRAARSLSPAAFPALCGVIHGEVAKLCEQIARARTERAELLDSIYGESHKSAFCEGADLSTFPT